MKINLIENNAKENNSIENNSNIPEINLIGNNTIEKNNDNILKNNSIENNNNIIKINSIGNNSKEKISMEKKSIENKSIENYSIENNKNNEKNQFLNKKRGEHTKHSTDNIFRRINDHYLIFLIRFLNEILKIFKIEGEFKDINYSFKRNLNITKFGEIKKESLIYFLQLDNNNKYKNKNFNKTLYTTIEPKCKNNIILNKLISKSFIEIFKDIYIKNKKDIILEGLKLNINKIFDDFLGNEDVKGDDFYKNRILEVVRKIYLEYKFVFQRYSSLQ